MKQLIGLGFSAFSLVPGVNPLIFAELFATNMVGIFFWSAFEELKAENTFRVPKRVLLDVLRQTKELSQFQFGCIRNVLSVENIKRTASRFTAWIMGDIVDEPSMPRKGLTAPSGHSCQNA
jgi:hypothetical protein